MALRLRTHPGAARCARGAAQRLPTLLRWQLYRWLRSLLPWPTPSTVTQEAGTPSEPCRRCRPSRGYRGPGSCGRAAHSTGRLRVPPTQPRRSPLAPNTPEAFTSSRCPAPIFSCVKRGPRTAETDGNQPRPIPPPSPRRSRRLPRRCSANTGTRTATNPGGPALAAGRKRMRLRGGRAGAALSSARNGAMIGERRVWGVAVYWGGSRSSAHRAAAAPPPHPARGSTPLPALCTPRTAPKEPPPSRPAPPLPGLRHAAGGGRAGRAAAGGARRSG